MKNLKILAFFCVFTVMPCISAIGQTIDDVSPRTREISFDGRVLDINPVTETLELEVFSFTLPNGKSSVLQTPKRKVLVLTGTQFFDGNKTIALNQLKIGEKITATGLDSGTGQPLRARIVFYKGRVSVPTSPHKPENGKPETHPEVSPKPQIQAVLKHADLFPLPYDTGDMKVSVADVGFDYTKRLMPNYSAWLKTPNYFCIFQFDNTKPDTTFDASRMTIRRIISPSGQVLRDFKLAAVSKTSNQRAFSDSRIDPRWEFVDVDVDIRPSVQAGTNGISESSITLENLPLPEAGQEISINREFVGEFGTRFTIVKIKRSQNSRDFILVWQHELAPKTNDVKITGFSYNLGRRFSGSGGLFGGTKSKSEHELTLLNGKDFGNEQLILRVIESAPTRENRVGYERHRFRLPVSKTLQTRPVQLMPEAALPLPNKTIEQEIEVGIEPTGISSSATMGTLWVKTPPDDVKRGLFWKPLDGKTTFTGMDKPVHAYVSTSNSYQFYWHIDGRPAQEDEDAFMITTHIPETAKTYDVDFRLGQKLTVQSNFQIKDIPVLGVGSLPRIIDEESDNTLILRKIVRYDSPKDLPRYVNYGESPLAGLALVFEKHPFLTDAKFEAQVLDVEDNTFRSLRSSFDIHRPFFQGDLTTADAINPKFHTMLVMAPPDARTLSVWMKTVETANNGKETRIQLRDIPNERSTNP